MTTESQLMKFPCEVCGGRGGWHTGTPKIQDNWADCGNCEGLGFYEREDLFPEPQKLNLLKYAEFKKLVIEQLEVYGEIKRYETLDAGETVEIDITPKNRTEWLEFSRAMLKYSYFSKILKISVAQSFEYLVDNKYQTYWTIKLYPKNVESLDSFVYLVKTFRAW